LVLCNGFSLAPEICPSNGLLYCCAAVLREQTLCHAGYLHGKLLTGGDHDDLQQVQQQQQQMQEQMHQQSNVTTKGLRIAVGLKVRVKGKTYPSLSARSV
jgi:hypothetical protein